MTHRGKTIQMTADFSSEPMEKELSTQNSVFSKYIHQEQRGTGRTQISER